MQHRQMQRWVSLTVAAPGPEALQAPPADSPVAIGEAPQPEELLSPGPAPDSATATPPDAEVGVPDSSAPGPEAIQAPLC